MWAESEGPGKGSTFSFSIKVPIAQMPPARSRDFVGAQPELAGQARARRRRQRDQPPHARAADRQVGHAVARHRVAARSAALARSGRRLRPRDPRHAHAGDGRPRSGAADSRAPRRAAARAVQLARPARGRRHRQALQRLSGEADPPVAAVRHAGGAAGEGRRAEGRGAVQVAARSDHGGAPSAAHPAGRGQRRQPEAGAAHPAADGLSRRPRVERHRSRRIGGAADLRRDPDGRADARDGRARSLAAHHREVVRRTSGRASSR